MTGVFYGERDKAGLRTLFSISLKSIVAVGLIIGIAGTLASPALVSLYFDSSDEAFDTTVRALAIYVMNYFMVII
jgi:Na+-driven multidrug efflux pump